MPRPTYLDFDPTARDADGIAEAQALSTAGALTLDGTQADLGTAAQWDIGDSYPADVAGARIRISVATDGVTWTVTGKDQDGNSITEAISGNNGAAVDSIQFYSQITAISGDGHTIADLTVGPAHDTTSKTIPLNWRSAEPPTYSIYEVDGDVKATIEEYFGDPQTVPLSTDGWTSVHTEETGNAAVEGTLHARAVRVRSATNGGEFQFGIAQN